MFHKAVSVKFNKGTSLEVIFQTGEVKEYDMATLFDKYPKLKELTDRKLFLSGKLMGYGIIWNDEIDIETETIYEDGILIKEVSPYNMIAAEAILKARSIRGISQKELANLTGIDQSDISKLERGVANPSVNTLKRIADALNMKLNITIE
ncbi:MAG: helix-turn-helix domain-containing protein [Clostridium sp.]|nr:helix-turn-helix domain-containing protein [Clostridium sp.]